METPFAVEHLLEWWLAEVQDVLGENLQSVLLFGSVTLGDFQPGWSDVDACVILHRPITQAEGQTIGLIHDQMMERFVIGAEGGWESGQVVEAPYIPATIARSQEIKAACYVAGGTTRRWDVSNPITAFDRYMLANHDHLYFGAPVDFSHPCKEDLIRQTERDIETLGKWRTQSAIWLASMLHWLARCIVFWRDGQMLSKTAALEYEISHSSPYADAFHLALNLRRGRSADTATRLETLLGYFREMADAAAQDIRRYIDQCINPQQGAPDGAP